MAKIKNIYRFAHSRMRSSNGQTLVEYALILLLIAIVVIIMVKELGSTLNNTYSDITSSVNDARR